MDCIKKDKEYYITMKNNKKIPVRKLQLEVLSIMDAIHQVCEKNNIEYALIAGSALGIVNYKGFIPWDDDMDICIKRKDYKKFIKAMEKDLDDKFYFQCFQTDKRYNVLIPNMKVRKKGTCIKEKNFLLNKFIDELYRTYVKLLMPIMVLLDNLHIPTTLLKKLVERIAIKYGEKNKNSKYTSQTIAIPWEKFLKEPVFLKEDVYPFKKYEFEGRMFYSYNNIEKVLKEWYGDNCLKKWNGKEWEETLPVEKRKPKHTVDINLEGDFLNEK